MAPTGPWLTVPRGVAARKKQQNPGIEIAPDLWAMPVKFAHLKEQDVNARVMPPREFDRLVENIKRRGALEGMIYCAQPGGEGPIEVVSGHHRMRAAVAAGLDEGWVLVDKRKMTRSEIVSKQLAHNALVGDDDPEVRQALIGMIDNPDDLLASGLPDDVLGQNQDERDAIDLFTPRVDFDYRTVSFAFLDHEKREFDDLLDSFATKQDLVVCCPEEQFDELLKVAAKFARVKDVRSGGTAISLMIRMAQEEVDRVAAEEAEREKAAK